LASCSALNGNKLEDHGLKRRNVDEYFVSSGVIRYFLPEVPYWANFSEIARCRREEPIKYLNLDLVRGSLSLTYEEAIQLQLMLNLDIAKLKEQSHINHIPFATEESLFFKASEKIQAGIRTFRTPDFDKLNLVWIDPHLDNVNKIKKLMGGGRMAKGHPIFLSLCLTYKGLESWMAKNDFANRNIRKMSYEVLSPYSLEGKLDTRYHIYLNELLGSKKVVNLFLDKDWNVPPLFEGKFRVIKY